MQRWKEEAEGAKGRARREACSEAEVTLAQGRVEHEAATAAIEMDRNALKKRAEAEEARWNKQEAALRRNCGSQSLTVPTRRCRRFRPALHVSD